MYVLTASQMQTIDDYTITQLGISQEVLMEKAALCSVEEILKHAPKHVLCVCGNGNNGGDGIAVARILLMKGICAAVCLCFEPLSGKESIQKQIEIFQKIGGEIVTEPDFSKYDIIVDAIFGIGLNREINMPFSEFIYKINSAKQNNTFKVVSLDIASGIHADNGRVMGCAVKADITVTFSYSKRGHLLYPGREYTGELVIADAGMYLEYSPLKSYKPAFFYNSKEECIYPKLPVTAHKGTAGRVLVIAGSDEMTGACYLSACAAFRMGCGLVDVYTSCNNLDSLKTILPEAILHNASEDSDYKKLNLLLQQADCVLLGPGISTGESAKRCVEYVMLHCNKKMVVDADAINCVAQNPVLLYNHTKMNNSSVVLTPHPKELSRLLNMPVSEILDNYSEVLTNTANQYGVILVGKGASTIVTDGKGFYINLSGNEGMATAGSGDVLAGMIAAASVREASIFEAACKGVYLHGLCGDYSAEQVGKTSLMAHDLLDGIIYLNKTE
ncbi:MAG: NAD(P)H-hydrate dehydratase [Lachnospiraceae bacterium]|nr:NAD(P)H-hydrate dehydratase [Lachnospiraceae bacterium]